MYAGIEMPKRVIVVGFQPFDFKWAALTAEIEVDPYIENALKWSGRCGVGDLCDVSRAATEFLGETCGSCRKPKAYK